MAIVPGLNIGVGLLILIILWIAAGVAVVVLAAIPKARWVSGNRYENLCRVDSDYDLLGFLPYVIAGMGFLVS